MTSAADSPSRPPIPDYELIRRIGRGAYGDVWLARGLTGVYRALKVVWRERFESAEPFEREFNGLKRAMALPEAARLGLLHVGQNEAAGFFYYVMELADDATTGRTVDPVHYAPLTLREVRQRRGRLPAHECVQIGIEVCRSLAGLHERGLVHRDIKPSNIIVVGGVPKLVDIGLVTESSDVLTAVGTPGFMPPEGPGRASADVYAVGRLLYELSTGLEGNEFPRLPAALGRGAERRLLFRLNEVVLRACDPDSARRPADAGELQMELEKLLRTGRVGSGRALAFAGLVVIGAVLTLVLARRGGSADDPASVATVETQSVAVLPFANLSGDASQEYFSDGLTEEILNALAREPGLRVSGRSSSFHFKGRNLPASETAKALHVAQLVEGSVRRAGDRVRITVQLTRASDGFSEPLGTFDREWRDVFALQEEVARAVVMKLTGRPLAKAATVATRNTAAYEIFLRARERQARGAVHSAEAVKLLEQAGELDPGFSLAWAQLGAARFRLFSADLDTRPENIAGARTALERALALDAGQGVALIARAQIRRLIDGDLAGARRDVEAAERADGPSSASQLVLASIAASTGAWDRVPGLAQAAVRLDPANGDVLNAFGLMLNFCGQFSLADDFYRRAADLAGTPNSPAWTNRLLLRARWRGLNRAMPWEEGMRGRDAGSITVLNWLIDQGRLDEARALRRRLDQPATALGPAPVSRLDALTLQQLGEVELARERAAEQAAEAAVELRHGNKASPVRYAYIQAQIVRGELASARAELHAWDADTKAFNAFRRWYGFGNYAVPLFIAAGETETALRLLEQVVAAGHQPGYQWAESTGFRPLRGQPRFELLVARAKAWAEQQPVPLDERATPAR